MDIFQNLVIIQGRMVSAPDYVTTPNGTEGVKFFLGVERITADGKRVTDAFHVSAFGEKAGTVHRLCRKGTEMLVRGQLRPLPYSAGADVLADEIKVAYTTPASGNAYAREPEQQEKIDIAED